MVKSPKITAAAATSGRTSLSPARFGRHTKALGRIAALALIVLTVGGAGSVASALPSPRTSVPGADWPGYLFSPGHSSYNAGATSISPTNAGQLTQAWKWQPPAPNPPNSAKRSLLASPTVVNGVVYQGVKDGDVCAIRESDQATLWCHFLAINTPLGNPPSCGVGDYQGVISTSTVTTDPATNKLTVYVFAPDGFLYALDAASGNTVWHGQVYTPSTTVNDYYSWGSPLVANGKVYIGVSSDCDNPLVPGGLQSFDQSTGAPLARWISVPTGQVGASVWSSPALANDGSILATTGNGYNNSGQPLYDESVVRLDPTTLTVLDHWQIPQPAIGDADFGASPTTFSATLNGVPTPMVGACNKNGFYYALKQSALSAGPVWSTQISVPYPGGAQECDSAATWDGTNLIETGGAPTTINGNAYVGSIRSLNPATGAIIWQRGLNGSIVGSPTEDGAGVVAAPTYQTCPIFTTPCQSDGGPTSTLGVYLFSVATGGIVGFIPYPQAPLFGQAVFVGSLLLVGGPQGSGLTAYQVSANPPPTITGLNPSTLTAGQSVPIGVTGTGFQNGLSVSSAVPGATFSPPSSVSSTSFNTVVTVPSTAPAGSYDLVVANPDGEQAICAGCLTVMAAPPPPPPPPPPVTTPGSPLAAPVTGMASTPAGDGYWLVNAAGAVSAHGAALNYGSMAGVALNAPINHIVATPGGKGYWLVAADGGTFTFGDAGFYGSTGSLRLNAPVVDIAPTPDGRGYWLVATDGGVFCFGDAAFQGSMGGQHLNKPVVGISADYATGGYWLVATDGGIFSFGAPFFGSTGNLILNRPINGMAATATGQGYWLVASDGGIFTGGDALFHGSTGGIVLNAPVVGMAADPATGGYWLVASDGGVFSFGAPFYGAD